MDSHRFLSSARLTGIMLLLAGLPATAAHGVQNEAASAPAGGGFTIEGLGRPTQSGESRPRTQGPVDPEAPVIRRPATQPNPTPAPGATAPRPAGPGTAPQTTPPAITIDPPVRGRTDRGPTGARAPVATRETAQAVPTLNLPDAAASQAAPPDPAVAATDTQRDPLADAPIRRSVSGGGSLIWAWLLAFAALAAGAIYFLRARGSSWQPEVGVPLREAPRSPAKTPEPVKPVMPPAAAADDNAKPAARAPRPSVETPETAIGAAVVAQTVAGLAISFQPDYAAATMTRVAVRYALAITNTGDDPVDRLVVRGTMIPASGGQDSEIAAFMDDSAGDVAHRIERIAPGETVEFEGDLALPLSEARGVRYGQRLLFIPVAALALDFVRDQAPGHVPLAYIVGVNAEGAEKMGPLRLDLGPKTYNSVGQRPLAYASAA